MVDTSIPPLVFFGTGPVAAESLRLLAKNFAIEAVVTKPRAPHHHGPVPVLDVAQELGCKVLTVRNKKELDELFSKSPVTSKFAVLIDFGIIVSQKIIDYFPLGILNSHFSILPDLRGADPITFAILSGQKQTGVSLMFLVEAMDEGPLIGYGEYDLPPEITTPELTKELILLSDALLTHDIPRIFTGEAKGLDQAVTKRPVSYSHKLSKADGVIDWNKSAVELEREVRAYIGWPGSHTTLGDKAVIITKAKAIEGNAKPGTLEVTNKTLSVGCKEGVLQIERIKPLGKSEMDIAGFLAGYGKILSN